MGDEAKKKANLSVLEKIEQSQSAKVLPFEMEEWGVVLELREPPHQEIKDRILRYSKENKKGKTIPDKFEYSLTALCLYSEGQPLFENTLHAERVLGSQNTRSVQKIIKAVRMLCLVENDEDESPLEKAEND